MLLENVILNQIVKHILGYGGKCFLVGGVVWDYLLGLPIKDYDVEIYNISAQMLFNHRETY